MDVSNPPKGHKEENAKVPQVDWKVKKQEKQEGKCLWSNRDLFKRTTHA